MKKITIIFFALMLTAATVLAQTWNIGTPNAASVTATISGSGTDLTLTISGTGAMKNFTLDNTNLSSSAPWYSSRNNIKTLVINTGVTNVGNYAFYKCSALTGTLTIPSSITSIGNYGFYSCSGLTGALTIPNSITSIGNYAFSYCSELTSVTIGNNVTTIGNVAFGDCTNLTSISVGTSNANYSSSNGILYNKNKTVLICCPVGKTGAVTIPNTVISIGDIAFSACTAITSVTIPSTVTYIGDGAFRGCTSLSLPALPSALQTIGNSAFYYCTGFSGNLTLPSSVTSIGNYAFYFCSGLSSITIGNNVTMIGNMAFGNCINLTSISVGTSNANYTSVNGVLYNKNKTVLVCYPTGKTGAFTIPSGIITVGTNAFKSCTGLTSVIIPSGVTAIGDTAFSACTALTSVTIPSTVTYIGNHAFRECTALSLPVLPSALKTIGNSAFYNCTNFAGNLILPSSVTYIGHNAFFKCTGLINELVLPAALDSIGTNAFYLCSGFTGTLILPNNIRFIGAEPFVQCDGIISDTETLTLPHSLIYIGYHAFRNFSNLKTINYDAVNCTTMVDANDTTRLPFRNCNAVKNINIGANVTKIPNFAFAGLSTVEYIKCDAITPPQIYLRTFRNIATDIPISVPCNATGYTTAEFWSNFTNIQTVGSTSIPYNLQATNEQAGIKLQWKGNAASYKIYRNNTQIATTSETTYTDNNHSVGSYCYQIRVDKSNSACSDALSNEVCINISNVNDVKTKHFKVYPVPASDIIFIEGDMDFTDITIYDIVGHEVLNSQKVKELNISNLPQGNYIVNILNNGISIERIKVVKN